MAFYDLEVPLKKLWLSNLFLSVLVQFTLWLISTVSGNLFFFILSYFVTLLSFLVLFDWKSITLTLNVVSQVFSVLSLLVICSSSKLSFNSFRAKWQNFTLKWFFPLVCLHSSFVSLMIIVLKRKYKTFGDFPLKDVVGLLKDCDSYFSENKKQREKELEAKKLAKEMRKLEIRKEEEVAKKIVDSLYSFTNRSNFLESETKNDGNIKSSTVFKDDSTNGPEKNVKIFSTEKTNEKVDTDSVNRKVVISIPDDLD